MNHPVDAERRLFASGAVDQRMIGRLMWWVIGIVVPLGLVGCSIADLPIYRGESRPPDVVEAVRRIDILPRNPQPTDGATAAVAQPRQAQVFVGNEVAAETPVRGAVSASADGYDLNFDNAPMTTVAKVILGDILGASYTIDPRIQGTVTLASGRPIPKSELTSVIESALRMSNVAMVRDASGYRLVPGGDAIGSGSVDVGDKIETGYGISIIPLRFVSAQTALRLIDGFATKAGAARAESTRNILLIQGSSIDRRVALETVFSFDADWMQGQSIGIFPLRNSTPEPVITELSRIMDAGEGGLGQQIVKFQPIARLNAVLVVTKKADVLKTADKWITRLDQSDAASNSLKVYRVRYGNARRIASLLNELFVGRGSGENPESASNQIAPGSGLATSSSATSSSGSGNSPTGQSAQSTVFGSEGFGGFGAGGFGGNMGRGSAGSLSGQSSGLGGRSTMASGVNDPNVIDPASGPLGSSASTSAARAGVGVLPGVRITADVANNSVLVFASQEHYRIIEQTIRQIDRPQRQVAIEGTIAEVTLNDNLNYGVQFFLKSSDLGLGTDKGSLLKTIGTVAIDRVVPGFNFLLGSEAAPRMILDALHRVTDVKVLSNPSLVVLDNQLAILQVGDQVPIATGSATVLTTNNTVVNTIDYRNTGVILRVIPRISHNGEVVLEIEQEISNVASTSTASTLTPTVSQRRVKSSISVASGQTVVLAGLISDQSERWKEGIPVLDAIPGLGEAFGSNRNTKKRTELIIFIRPQIIRNGVDAHIVAEELRAKMGARVVGDWFPRAVR